MIGEPEEAPLGASGKPRIPSTGRSFPHALYVDRSWLMWENQATPPPSIFFVIIIIIIIIIIKINQFRPQAFDLAHRRGNTGDRHLRLCHGLGWSNSEPKKPILSRKRRVRWLGRMGAALVGAFSFNLSRKHVWVCFSLTSKAPRRFWFLLTCWTVQFLTKSATQVLQWNQGSPNFCLPHTL